MFRSLSLLALAAIPSVLGVPRSLSSDPSHSLSKRACTNSATDRSCWGDYDLSTDYYTTVPDTGVTREYWFDIQNGTAAPDGVERIVLTVNGTIPGPTIIADWGDTVVIHVTNSMQNNGTSIHWHGVRQNTTNQMDGVASISQCPTAPGDSMTYTWRATQYGSSWYHSHWAVQAWDGIFGGILINGPATANYDEDKGNLFLNDWSHQTAEVLAIEAAATGPPTMDNALINGTNVWDDVGAYFETSVDAGTSYRFRLVNGAADTHFRFSIDNHTMTVISADFVPITPYVTTNLSIGMGQRYDVVVTADQGSGNFWIRSTPQESCSDNAVTNITGILRYDNTSTADPTSTGYTLEDSCLDEAITDLVPYLVVDVGTTFSDTNDEAVAVVAGDTIFWEMAAIAFDSQWDYPSTLQIAEGNNTWTTDQHAVLLPTADEYVQIVITTTFAQAHPIHLHGHDFWVLASGTGTYTADNVTLATTGAPRRDVAMLPATGYLIIAFKTDNPGAWLMHCHIAWHQSEGFAMQFIERESEIPALQDVDFINSTCSSWDAYATLDDIVQTDSGI